MALKFRAKGSQNVITAYSGLRSTSDLEVFPKCAKLLAIDNEVSLAFKTLIFLLPLIDVCKGSLRS